MSWPRVAVVGASLELAGDLTAILLDRGIAADHVRLLDREETAGETVEVGDLRRRVEWAVPESLAGADLVLFCGADALARELLPAVRARGAIALDATGCSRGDGAVPLVVPEVNGGDVRAIEPGAVLASPTPAVVGLALALAPLHRAAGLERVVVTAIEPASRRGRDEIEMLSRQSVQLMQGQGLDRGEFHEQIAFNVRVEGADGEGGWSATESAVARELRMLLGAPDLAVAATVVRAPVFFGSAQAIHAQLARGIVLADAELAIRGAAGLLLAGSVEDRLAVSVESARRRKERAAGREDDDEDERDVAEELAEDGLEMDDDEAEQDVDPWEAELAGEEERERRAPDARERAAESAAEETADLLPGPVDVSGSEFVHVARLRLDADVPGGVALWIAFDELRRGVAMNLAGIVELVRSRRA